MVIYVFWGSLLHSNREWPKTDCNSGCQGGVISHSYCFLLSSGGCGQSRGGVWGWTDLGLYGIFSNRDSIKLYAQEQSNGWLLKVST